MQVIFDLTEIKTPTSIALGNFDGIHRGHSLVIAAALKKSSPHAHSTLLTFHPHPRQLFSGKPHSLLTPLPEKIAHLQTLGVEQVVLLPFNEEIACLTPEEFVTKILVQQLQAIQVSVGANFYFGRDRSGHAQDLARLAQAHNIQPQIIPLQNLPLAPNSPANFLETAKPLPISSSSIRHHLSLGQIPVANMLLGRSYTLMGTVIQGKKLGRTLGFPTANVQIPTEKFLPKYGVYAVTVIHQGKRLPGVMNVGVRPSVDTENIDPHVEVHILDWQGNLYGETLTIALREFLRPEQKFASIDALKAQINIDAEVARQLGNIPDDLQC